MSLDHYKRIFKKTVDKNILFTVHFDLTYKCNLKCVHCYIVQEEKEELSTEEVKSILDQLAEANTLYLTFSGGEILTRRDFFEVARYTREKGFALRLLTNGTLITPKVADQIKDIQPLSVEISLYATTPSIHEGITKVPGSYNKTIRALKLLKARGVKITIKSLLMKQNVGEFDNLKKMAKDLDSGFVYDITIVPKDNGSKEPLSYRLTEEDLFEFLSSEVPFSNWKPRKISGHERVCGAGLNTLYISPYGQATPCIGIRERIGDLREEPLHKVWKSPLLAKIRAKRIRDLSVCSNCPLLSYCNRCPGVALLEDGNLWGPSTSACIAAKVRKTVYENARISTEKKNTS